MSRNLSQEKSIKTRNQLSYREYNVHIPIQKEKDFWLEIPAAKPVTKQIYENKNPTFLQGVYCTHSNLNGKSLLAFYYRGQGHPLSDFAPLYMLPPNLA